MARYPKLYMLLGYPGAGKTTTSTFIQEITGAVHLNSDTVRLELFPHPTFTQKEHDALYKELNTRTKKLLKQGKDVIYDANLNRRKHRQEKYDLCQEVGAQPLLLWVRTAKPLAKQRRVADAESHHLVPTHEDPSSMFDRLVGVFEEPTTDEPYIQVDGTKVTRDYIRQLLL